MRMTRLRVGPEDVALLRGEGENAGKSGMGRVSRSECELTERFSLRVCGILYVVQIFGVGRHGWVDRSNRGHGENGFVDCEVIGEQMSFNSNSCDSR